MGEKKVFTDMNSLLMDVMRVIAAWGVMLGHGVKFCKVTIFRTQDYFPYIQNIGVVLLIMISGFFIAYSLDRKRKDPLYGYKDFLIDKACRIEIAFIPAMILVAIMDKVNMTLAPDAYKFYESYNVLTFIGNIFQLQDIPKAGLFVTSFGTARPFWTLAIEWWFYLLAGFVVLYFIPKVKKKQVRLWQLALMTVIAIPAIVNLLGGRGNGLTFTWGLGILIYLLYDKCKHYNTTLLAGLTLLSLIGTIYCGTQVKEAYCIQFVLCTAVTMFFAMAFGASVEKAGILPKTRKVMQFFSSYTFSLYLVHYSVFCVMRHVIGGGTSWERLIACVLISNALAIPLSMIFERRGKKLAEFIKSKLKTKEGSVKA